jgi:hypothetical protein
VAICDYKRLGEIERSRSFEIVDDVLVDDHVSTGVRRLPSADIKDQALGGWSRAMPCILRGDSRQFSDRAGCARDDRSHPFELAAERRQARTR